MDEDLQQMTKEELIEEAKKLRDGIREHRDSTGHELCWGKNRSKDFSTRMAGIHEGFYQVPAVS